VPGCTCAYLPDHVGEIYNKNMDIQHIFVTY
jgi:hypothetical protein